MTLAKTFPKSWNLGRTLAFLPLFYLNFGRFVPFFFSVLIYGKDAYLCSTISMNTR